MHLHRERLVELPQIDVGHGLAGALQQLRNREHRADAHFVGLAAGDREAAEDAQRLRARASRRASALMTTQAEAPSENWLALPAAITPPGVAARIFATRLVVSVGADALVGAHGHRRASCSRPLSLSAAPMTTSMGTISASNRPAACAAAARCWLCTP